MSNTSTILVKDVLYRASILLQDLAPQFSRWSEGEMVAWLNDGQRAIAKYLPMSCSRIDRVKLRPGVRQSIALIPAANCLDIDGVASTSDVYGVFLLDIFRNMGANGSTSGSAVRVIPREVMDNIDSTWYSKSGSGAIDHFVFDPRTPKDFFVTPGIPSSGTWWVEMSYIANPCDVPYSGTSLYAHSGASALTISIDDRYTDDLVNYICARAFLKDSEFAAGSSNANTYMTVFMSSLNAQVEAMTGINPNLSFLPFSPASPATAK